MELESDSRDNLMSILEYLPLSSSLVVGSSEPGSESKPSSSQSPPSLLFWPCPVVDALKALARGPDHSNVDSGEVFFLAISDIRLSLRPEPLPFSAAHGFSLFFDDFMPRTEATKWFREVLPGVANLLLRLPPLLEAHYKNASGRLRLLDSQQPGIVFLSQELIGALLACSLFCLFPNSSRGAKHLPMINFDHLFASLYDNYSEKQENKLKCIIHYFGRICSCMPVGNVSFERKVLSLDQNHQYIPYPNADFWSKSTVSLCPFEVHNSGLIEDQSNGALEVDFANKFFGGGALTRGCVQEEIRFMINPELIVGMLFLPSMADNEAIEIVGAERFSNYTGYASSFRFCGNFVDTRDIDSMGRRKTRIIAIDALANPGRRQYGITYLIREVNKAFCGFYDQCKSQHYQRLFQEDGLSELRIGQNGMSKKNMLFHKAPSTACGTDKDLGNMSFVSMEEDLLQPADLQNEIGIATGNWGCGAFGGDPEHKAIIQWLAASQALRPFILYYTFGLEALQTLHQVTEWIISHGWSVGDLWNMLVEYSSQRLKKETEVGFFTWLIPSLSVHDPMMLDLLHVS